MGYFEGRSTAVEYDEALDAVVGRVEGYAESEEFRAYMNALIEAIEDSGTRKLLSDSKELGPMSEEDKVWSVEDWAPRAEAAGLEVMAFVIPESVIAEMSFDRVMEMAEDDIERGFFDDVDEARSWLRDWESSETTADPGGTLDAG